MNLYNEIVFPSVPFCSLRIAPDRNKKPTEKKWICDMHYHAEIELLQIMQGHLKCITQTGFVDADEGDIIFINEGIPHYTEVLSGTLNRLIQFRAENISPLYGTGINHNMSRFLRRSANDCMVLKKGTDICMEMTEVLNKMHDEINDCKAAYETYIKGYLTIITGILSRYNIIGTMTYNSESMQKILPVVNYTDLNFHKDISLEKICNKFSVNKSYFCRVFKKATGRTYIEYLNFVRVTEAERLLHSENQSITDIALECGFVSVSYFNRVFKNTIGCTPREYKKIASGERSFAI